MTKRIQTTGFNFQKQQQADKASKRTDNYYMLGVTLLALVLATTIIL